MEAPSNLFQCPLCGLTDAITKVSSIVDGGTATSISYHTLGSRSGTSVGTSTTAIARKLAAPSLPRPPLGDPNYIGCIIASMLLVGAIGTVFGWMALSEAIASGSTEDGIGSALFFLVIGAFCIGYPIIALIVTGIRRKKLRPTWKQAMKRWDRLYYCARNDVVFLPGESGESCVPASQMRTLLYANVH